MYRSTTPVLTLHVTNSNIDLSTIEVCHLTVQSVDNTHKIIYENPEIDVEHKIIRQFMTQAETKAFDVGDVKIQIKAKLSSGAVIPSKIVFADMKEILEEAEL